MEFTHKSDKADLQIHEKKDDSYGQKWLPSACIV